MFRRSDFVQALLNDSHERTNSSAESVDLEEWKDRISRVKVPNKHTEELVLDFLLHENHKMAADRFQKDTGLTSHKLEQLELKQKVVGFIKNLQIDKAIEFFNGLSKERFEQDTQFQAELLLLKLYSTIKAGDNVSALKIAKSEVQIAVKGRVIAVS